MSDPYLRKYIKDDVEYFALVKSEHIPNVGSRQKLLQWFGRRDKVPAELLETLSHQTKREVKTTVENENILLTRLPQGQKSQETILSGVLSGENTRGVVPQIAQNKEHEKRFRWSWFDAVSKNRERNQKRGVL